MIEAALDVGVEYKLVFVLDRQEDGCDGILG